MAAFMASGAQPAMLESLDRTSLRLLNEFGDFGLDDRAGTMLLMQSDSGSSVGNTGKTSPALGEVESFLEIATAQGARDTAFSDDVADNDALVAVRRQVQPTYERHAQGHGGGQSLDDICLPRGRMPEFYDRLEQIRAESGLTIAVVAHAGDGNIHPSVFFDAHDPVDVARAEATFDEIMQLGLDLGGTITGQHGVGYLKRRWLPRELDEGSRRLHREVKHALDPQGILNPGKMFAQL